MVTRRDRESQQKALSAARAYINKTTTKTLSELADEAGIARSSVASARLVLTHGTPQEIAALEEGKSGMKNLREAVVKRLTPEQIKSFKTDAQRISDQRRESDKVGSELWSKLSVVLKGITSMPTPADAVKYVSANHIRAATVDAQIENVSNWIKEFAYEWSFHKLSKSPNNASDAGTGDKASGT